MTGPVTRAKEFAPASSLGLEVVVVSGSERGKIVALDDEVRIGKAEDNDLVLRSDTVSRHHCLLTKRGAFVHVQDLDSTNGVKVQGAKIREGTLPAGTVMTLGEIELLVRPKQARGNLLPSDKTQFGEVIAKSVAMRSLFAVLERVAESDATVLLQGETGTGKDVLARSIHAESDRKGKAFVVVDCGAVSYNLIESELFGHERGAFTGAVNARAGAFELADGGTLFLDEIGELPLDIQPKLLRVLEMKEYRRVGGNKVAKSNVRVIAATKRDLEREVAGGRFREDLFFRLAVVPAHVPALRTRREDIRPLVAHFTATEGGQPVSEETLSSLEAHDWPGNVRELRNVLERARVLEKMGAPVDFLVAQSRPASSSVSDFDPDASYREVRGEFETDFEKRYVSWLLERHGNNMSAAARAARMDRKHLYDLAKKHGIRGD